LNHSKQVTKIAFEFEGDSGEIIDWSEEIAASLRGHPSVEEISVDFDSPGKTAAICAVLPPLPKFQIVEVLGTRSDENHQLGASSFSSLFQVQALSELHLKNFNME
jgi:stage III sporulation protein SpoIIIAA